MLKYSRQREAIKTFLAGRYDHPTAETVYLGIKEEFPNISLGTVYRNLSLLSDIGEIQKLSTGIGPDRFDGNPALHYHFICKHCGSVLDLSVNYLEPVRRKIFIPFSSRHFIQKKKRLMRYFRIRI